MQDPRFQAFSVPGPADGLFYIHDFITEAEEDHLVKKIDESPLPKWATVPTGRRLQYWGGVLTKNNALIPEPLPSYFNSFPNLIQRVADTGAFVGSKAGEPNQVLVNEYLCGQGIDPHTDGPAYFPATATISLLWPVILLLHPPTPSSTPPSESASEAAAPTSVIRTESATRTEPVMLVLEPRSLLLLTGAAYSSWRHEILHAEFDDFGALRRQGGLCANAALLGGPRMRELVRPDAVAESGDESAEGNNRAESREVGNVKREKRFSVTLRAVERVVKGLSIGGRRS